MNKHVNKPAYKHTVSEGKIDKISLTFTGYPIDQIGWYQSFLIDLVKWGKAKQLYTKKNGYKMNVLFGLSNMGDDSNYGGPVLVSLFPTKSGMAQMRCEFNPSTLGFEGVKAFVYDFGQFFLSDGYAEFYQHARVSRLDVAFDMHGMDINDAHIWSNSLKVSQKYNGVGGRTETLILGSKKGRSTVIYDKATQLLKTKGIALTEPYTRIEARLKNACMLKNLVNLKSPILDLHISSMKPPKNLDKDLWLLFNAYSHTKTPNAALQSLSPKIRKVLTAELKNQHVDYWNSKELWATWPDIIKKSGLYAYYGQQQHFDNI